MTIMSSSSSPISMATVEDKAPVGGVFSSSLTPEVVKETPIGSLLSISSTSGDAFSFPQLPSPVEAEDTLNFSSVPEINPVVGPASFSPLTSEEVVRPATLGAISSMTSYSYSSAGDFSFPPLPTPASDTEATFNFSSAPDMIPAVGGVSYPPLVPAVVSPSSLDALSSTSPTPALTTQPSPSCSSSIPSFGVSLVPPSDSSTIHSEQRSAYTSSFANTEQSPFVRTISSQSPFGVSAGPSPVLSRFSTARPQFGWSPYGSPPPQIGPFPFGCSAPHMVSSSFGMVSSLASGASAPHSHLGSSLGSQPGWFGKPPVVDHDYLRMMSVSTPEFVELKDSHEELRWRHYQTMNRLKLVPFHIDDKSSTRFSFMAGAHRVTIQIDCPESHLDPCLPILTKPEYYTIPTIEELATREREEKGYCSRVKDFVVGRHGYGSIMFPGETDVRKLELDSIIQFNNKEVEVYAGIMMSPPVGEGLNKPAVVTLLNVKYFDEKGEPYKYGAVVEKIIELLRKTCTKMGAEFLSYDAVDGVWKFYVKNFVP